MTKLLILAVVTAIVTAKTIAAVEESLLIAVTMMTIGSISYSGTVRHLASWLVLVGTITILFSLPSLASPVYYLILVLLGVIVSAIIMPWWVKTKGWWTSDNNDNGRTTKV